MDFDSLTTYIANFRKPPKNFKRSVIAMLREEAHKTLKTSEGRIKEKRRPILGTTNRVTNMVDINHINPTISIVTTNVNGLN